MTVFALSIQIILAAFNKKSIVGIPKYNLNEEHIIQNSI